MDYIIATGFMLAGLYMALRKEIQSVKPKKRAPAKKKPPTGEEYVYIIHNPYFQKGVFKIGLTTREVDTRMKELHTTGVPAAFEKCIIMRCDDCKGLEQELHNRFKDKRVNPRREFFILRRSDINDIRRRYARHISLINESALDNALGGPDKLSKLSSTPLPPNPTP